MILNELIKEKMKTRTTDPMRAKVIGLLVEAVQKTAKTELREPSDNDIGPCAKKMTNEALKAIEEYKKGNGDFSHLEEEIKILEPFLPKTLSEEATIEAVKTVVESLPEDQRTMKNIMPKLKEIPFIDMKVASAVVKTLLG